MLTISEVISLRTQVEDYENDLRRPKAKKTLREDGYSNPPSAPMPGIPEFGETTMGRRKKRAVASKANGSKSTVRKNMSRAT
jgi:hypothetical protein